MPTPSLEDFCTAVVRSRLVEPADVDAVRRDLAAAGQSDVRAAAAALVRRGMLTRWQAKRLAGGDAGPFFVGDYRLMERHEGPGSALLFTARHEPSRRTVSLVLLNGKLCRQVEVWTAIVERTTAAHHASDPMLSRTWALEQADRTRFVVCEAVAGETLTDELTRLGPLSTVEAGQLVLQVARAVQEMHAVGRVHGGLSLDAVIREPPAPGAADRSGRVRLLQFPLVHDPHLVPLRAQAFGADEVARLGRRASYVAPELLLPGRACDTRSDVYALGCMLHALLAGVAPCWQGDPAETLRRAAFAGPEPLGPPRVPVEVASLVGFMTARDPQARYATAADAAHAIATCLGLVPSPAAPVLQGMVSGAVQAPEAAVGTARGAAATNLPPGASHPPRMGPVDARQPEAAASATTVVIRRRARHMRMIGTGIAGAVLCGAAIMIARNVDFGPGSGAVASRRPGPETAARTKQPQAAAAPVDRLVEPARGVPPQAAPVPEPPATAPASVARQLVVDDATLPWASPTSGEPPTLAYLPPGSQVVLLARPADILADEEGRRFIRALGPAAAAAIESLAKACGCQPADVETLQAGWQANERGEVTGGFAIRFIASKQVPPDDAARAAAWGETTPEQLDGETIHKRGGLSLWVPSAEAGRVLVLAPESLLTSIVEQATAAKPAEKAESVGLAVNLSPDLAAVAAMLDQTRHLTIFGQPQALEHDGRGLLAGPLAKLAEPLGDFLGEAVQAAAASLHFGTSLYAELDAVATPDMPASKVAPRLLAGVDRLATAAEDYCSSLDPDPYGRKLVMRLPGMIRVLAGNARAGAEGRGAVVNAYLPGPAAHNLALAAELALAQPAGASAGQALAAVTAPQDALGKLQKKITLVFAKDTLEKTIQMVSEEVGVPMEILGPDLQLEGITKNQSFGLDETEKSAEQVLRVILAKANPDGKLVFVVRKKDGVESIEITTRAAVAKRGDTLPPGQ